MARIIARRPPIAFPFPVIAGVGTVNGGVLYPDFPFDHSRSIVGGSLYVDPVSGSSGNNGLSQGAAKQTIAQAVSALTSSSSKIIYMMDGTHVIASPISLSAGSSGTHNQLTSLPGHEPTIDMNGLDRGFDLDGANYWDFSHFHVTDWGSASGWGGWSIGEDNNTSNVTFFCIDGDTGRGGDNNGMVHVYGQRTTALLIDRCRIRFTGNNTSAHQNTSGIFVVRGGTSTGTILIDHCEIDGFPINLYHKHGEEGRTSLSNAEVRNTVLTNSNRLNAGYNPAGWLYTNVIFGSSNSNNTFAEEDGGAAGDANQFVHVTFYTRVDLAAQGDGANNEKFTDCAFRLGFSIADGSITSDSNYNAYGAGSILNGGALAAWRSANGSDAQSVQGTFTVVGGDDSTAGFYKLTGIGINAASDGSDCGANTANIGIRGS